MVITQHDTNQAKHKNIEFVEDDDDNYSYKRRGGRGGRRGRGRGGRGGYRGRHDSDEETEIYVPKNTQVGPFCLEESNMANYESLSM